MKDKKVEEVVVLGKEWFVWGACLVLAIAITPRWSSCHYGLVFSLLFCTSCECVEEGDGSALKDDSKGD